MTTEKREPFARAEVWEATDYVVTFPVWYKIQDIYTQKEAEEVSGALNAAFNARVDAEVKKAVEEFRERASDAASDAVHDAIEEMGLCAEVKRCVDIALLSIPTEPERGE